MTSPHVSEQEVEAALLPIASAMFESYYSAIGNDKPNLLNEPASSIKLWKEDAYPVARAALTAAAQVKGRGGELAATPQQERDLEAYTESIARALHEAHAPYCDYTYPFDDPMSSNDMYRALARAVTRVAPTEPDSGPDVLGMRKGDE